MILLYVDAKKQIPLLVQDDLLFSGTYLAWYIYLFYFYFSLHSLFK